LASAPSPGLIVNPIGMMPGERRPLAPLRQVLTAGADRGRRLGANQPEQHGHTQRERYRQALAALDLARQQTQRSVLLHQVNVNRLRQAGWKGSGGGRTARGDD
jgi:hypothetical protein